MLVITTGGGAIDLSIPNVITLSAFLSAGIASGIGGHKLVDDPPQLAVADIGVEHDAADLPEQKDLFVGGFGNRQAELIQFSTRSGIGLSKTAIEKVHDLIGDFFH